MKELIYELWKSPCTSTLFKFQHSLGDGALPNVINNTTILQRELCVWGYNLKVATNIINGVVSTCALQNQLW